MLQVFDYLVASDDAGARLDRYVAAASSARGEPISRSLARRIIDWGGAYVDERRVRTCGFRVRSGQRVCLCHDPDRPFADLPFDPAWILHEDGELVVVAKPAGVPSVPTRDRVRGSLQYAVEGFLRQRGGRRRAVPVHRLDWGTSGVLVFARTRHATRHLGRAFHQRQVDKQYLALVEGRMDLRSRRIRSWLSRVPGPVRRFRSSANGRLAETRVEPIRWAGPRTLVLARPITGRSHQIRVHLRDIGHPVVGDDLYGDPGQRHRPARARGPATRLMLHARRLTVPHPATGDTVSFDAPLPPDFVAVLQGAADALSECRGFAVAPMAPRGPWGGESGPP